jgi:prophage antirepressor-like protein
MHDDIYTPTTFFHFDLSLRAVLIDDEPWFVASDFCRLIGHRHPERVVRRAVAASADNPFRVMCPTGLSHA